MHTSTVLIAALSAAATVSAHGKVAAVTGNMGGNGTALAIQGDVVARFGKNSATEKDTTVFGGNANNPKTNGLGESTVTGKITVAKTLSTAMKLSGSTLPQVSDDGNGELTGTWRVVTSDGTANNAKGDLFAVIDPTGTGEYSKGMKLTAQTDLVGNGNGNVVQRSIERVLRALGKRATNVGADAKFSVKIPAGVKCTGTDKATGATNFCLLKLANNNGNGPFGGNIPFQVAAAGAAAPANASAAAKREVSFEA